MNEGLRKTIRVLLFTKYLKKLGLKDPKIPDLKFWKEFQLPPMPDTSALLAEVNKQVSTNPNDLYTQEYLDAVNGYNAFMAKEKEKLDAIVEEQREIKTNAKDITDIFKQIETIDKANKAILDAKESYNNAKKTAWKNFKLDTIQKYKKIPKDKKSKAKKSADGETKSKKEKAKSAASAIMQSAIAKQYEQYVKKELEIVKRKLREVEKFYEDCKTIFVETPKKIKRYFNDDDGLGKQMVDEECDKIDRCWENLCESCKELSVDITTMTAKIPNPDVIVVGTAAGMPNPGHKIMVFMENVKKVATDIKKILMYVKEMKSIAEGLGFSMETIAAFAGMIKVIEALTGDFDKQFKNSVKRLQRKTKWIAEIKETLDDDDDENEPDDDPEHKTRKAGYKYAELNVDWENHTVEVLGYKCYCTRKAKSGKKAWFDASYVKKGGDHVDNKGKKYYWISAQEMNDIFAQDDFNSKNWEDEEQYLYDENGNVVLDADGNKVKDMNYTSSMYAGASYNYDNNTTQLILADGRIVTIDYLASAGDKIKLNDGTFIEVV